MQRTCSNNHIDNMVRTYPNNNKSRSAKAGLQFAVWRAEKTVRAAGLPCGAGAPVYLAAVMEYLTAEMLELSGNSARDAGRRHIQISDVYHACENDEELRALVFGTEFQVGLLPRGSYSAVGAMLPGAETPEHDTVSEANPEDFSSSEGGNEDYEEEEEEEEEESDHDEIDPEERRREIEGFYVDSDYEGLEQEGAEYELPDDQEEELDSSKPTGWLDQSLDPERMVNGRAEVWKVLQQIHPGARIHQGALELLVQLVQHCGDQLSFTAIELASTSTMEDHLVVTSREIQTAVRLMIPGELAKHAVSEGTKAVTTYCC